MHDNLREYIFMYKYAAMADKLPPCVASRAIVRTTETLARRFLMGAKTGLKRGGRHYSLRVVLVGDVVHASQDAAGEP